MTIPEMEQELQSAGERLFTLSELFDKGTHGFTEEALFGIGQFLKELTRDVKAVRESLEVYEG